MQRLCRPIGRLRPCLARSYYENVDGIARDKRALAVARAAVSGQGDGRISKADADEILTTLADGQGVTATEFSTAFVILRDFKFTPGAADHFIGRLAVMTPVK